MATVQAQYSANAFITPKRLPSGISVVKVVKVSPVNIDGVEHVNLKVLAFGREVHTIRAKATEEFARIF